MESIETNAVPSFFPEAEYGRSYGRSTDEKALNRHLRRVGQGSVLP
jgi:hypothetical protein